MRYPWAVPGAKVVCVLGGSIDTRPGVNRSFPTPVSGEVYTVLGVVLDVWDQSPRLLVRERPNVNPRGGDQGWCISRFRPLHSLESDMALFAHLLTPAPTSPMLPTKELTDQ